MIDFRKHLEFCETIFDMTTVATCLIAENKIKVEDSRELFQNIFELAQKFEQSHYDSERYMDAVDAYTMKHLLLKYGDLSKLHGRIWWDIEQQDFVSEAQLYDEYLVMRHDDLTFEEYIRGCQTSENGTLELVKGD